VSKKRTETPDEFPAIPEPPRESIIQPIIDDLKRKPTTHFPSEDEVAAPNPCAPEAAELDQDPAAATIRTVPTPRPKRAQDHCAIEPLQSHQYRRPT